MPYYQQQLNMLSNNYYNKLVDICCRVVSTDGEVTLEERIWMTKLKEIMLEALKEYHEKPNYSPYRLDELQE